MTGEPRGPSTVAREAREPAPDGRVLGIAEHPLRHRLIGELHARPYLAMHPPLQATHLLLLSGEDAAQAERAHVARLCTGAAVPPPPPGAKQFLADLGHFHLRWERHTEFSTYTFHVEGPFAEPFRRAPLERVAAEWLTALPGRILVATHLAVEPRGRAERSGAELAELFATATLSAARTGAGKAVVWTDHRIHADGFGRILVHDVSLTAGACGRLTQRIFEAFDYRVLALLGLPLAREIGPRLGAAERSLAAITARLAAGSGLEDERQMLAEVSALAAEVEAMASATGYRFAATRAYYELVGRRIGELREERIEGLQTLSEFFRRRLEPAVATCAAAARRQRTLSARVGRAGELLRTRVDVALEEQNRDLLASMERRAGLQLRLQETVEGLSVVVLSYYLLGLGRYALKALEALGIPVEIDLATGAALPVVLGAVYLALRWLRRRGAGPEQ